MMKPMIGVTPLMDEKRDSYWMLPGYMQGVQQAGGIPVMLPLTADEAVIRQLAQTFDGFLFTGGHDVCPKLYGAAEMAAYCACCEDRDEMESALLEEVLKLDKPILGICRGIQFLNTALGGTLYQDLPTQRPTRVEHHQQPPYDVPVHSVDICMDSPLYELLQEKTISVNSYHHQAIRELSPKLKTMAISQDGLVEAVYMPDKRYVRAVQWHPELAYAADKNSRKIFEEFVKASVSGIYN